MMTGRYEKHGPALVEAGFDITPVDGKKPVLKGWTRRPASALDYEKFTNHNIGVVCGGKHNVIAVDIDVPNEQAAIQIRELADNLLGVAPERIGNWPRTMLVYRCASTINKSKTSTFDIGNTACTVEILAEGQQFVASGTHPETKKKYRWPGDSLADYTAETLTNVSHDDVIAFLAEANQTLSKYGAARSTTTLRVNGAKTTHVPFIATSEREASPDRLLAALACIPNDNLDWDEWNLVGMALRGAAGDDPESREACRDLFHKWSEKSDKYEEAETDKMWRGYRDIKYLGAGTIFHHAKAYGYDIGEAVEEDEAAENAATALTATPLGVLIPMGIPNRPWLFGDQLLTGHVSAFVAPPGVGKSTLTIEIGLAVAASRDFADFKCHKQGNVWLFNNEDDRDEMHRRIAASAQIMDIDLEVLAGRVFLNTGYNRPLLVARPDRKGNVIQTPDVEACITEIKKNGIKLFIVDPFAETHTVNENSNDDIKQVAAMFRRIAKETGCAVLLVHHTRKTASGVDGGVAGDMDSARGAGAFIGVCRVVSTLFPMSKSDAEMYGMRGTDRYLYVRFDGAKANLSLVTHKARWFQRESVEIANGDTVGALSPWAPPGPFDGITTDHLIDIQTAVQSRANSGEHYLEATQAGDNWIGSIIADVCELDIQSDRKRILAMFDEWCSNKALAVEVLPNKNRKKKRSVVVAEWAEK